MKIAPLWQAEPPGQALAPATPQGAKPTGHHNSSAPETDLRLAAAPLLNNSLSGGQVLVRPRASPRVSCNHSSLHICGALGGGPGHIPGIGSQPSVATKLPCSLPRSLPVTHEPAAGILLWCGRWAVSGQLSWWGGEGWGRSDAQEGNRSSYV